MRMRQFMLCPALAMGLLMTPHLAGTAGAAPPAEVSGTYTAQLTGGTLPEGRGNATFFEFSNAVVISGDIRQQAVPTFAACRSTRASSAAKANRS